MAIEKVKCLIEEKNAERAMPLSIACGYAIRDDEEANHGTAVQSK